MIREFTCYKCKCEKCGREWITKSYDVPRVCPKCHSVKWNDDGKSETTFTPKESPLAVSIPEYIPQVETSKQDDPERSNEQIDDNWIELPQTRENGEKLWWHKRPKGNPVCYKRETDWDSFA